MAKGVKFDIRAQNKTDDAFNAVKGNLKTLDSGFSAMTKAAIGIGAAVGGIYALAKGISVVTEAANVQMQAEAKLSSVLEATDHAAGLYIDELKDMASELQSVTTFGDQAILSGMSILATFKNVGQDAFKRTTKAAMDMSTVMEQDLKSSFVQLGKALNDPIKGVSALSEVGVSFTEEQKEMIKSLVESGDMLEAQQVILQELESEFGGAAETVANTFGGALDQLGNSWGDVLEDVGFALTKNEAFMAIIKEMKVIIENDLRPVIDDMVKEFIAWVGPVDQLRSKFKSFVETVKVFINVGKGIGSVFNNVGSSLGQSAAYVANKYDEITGQGAFEKKPNDETTGKGKFAKSTSVTNNITIAPTMMTGDRNAAMAVAGEISSSLKSYYSKTGRIQ